MPSPGTKKSIFDTNIYIYAMRYGSESQEYQLLFSHLPRTYLSSVVSAELYSGVVDAIGRKLVQRFISRTERVGRIVTPTHQMWNKAGQILARIKEEEPKYKSKSTGLLNDILIALSALQIAATLYTRNAEDFQLIQRRLTFLLETIS